jgi:hypothetical protein
MARGESYRALAKSWTPAPSTRRTTTGSWSTRSVLPVRSAIGLSFRGSTEWDVLRHVEVQGALDNGFWCGNR